MTINLSALLRAAKYRAVTFGAAVIFAAASFPTAFGQPGPSPVREPGLNGVEIFSAVNLNDTAKVRSLLVPGADLNYPIRDETPLILAIRNKNPGIAKMLLTAGADPHLGDQIYGASPLQWAAQTGDLEMVDMLVNVYKVDVNYRSKSGNTALHKAADFNPDDRITKFLLSKGADPTVINNKGRSPMDEAIAGKKGTVVAILLMSIDPVKMKKLQADFAANPPAPVAAIVPTQTPIPTPAPTPRPVYGAGEDDPGRIAYLRNQIVTSAERGGFTLLNQGTITQQATHFRSMAGGVRVPVFPGTLYQFVIVSKNALAINGEIGGDVLRTNCEGCKTSITEYSTSVASQSDSTGAYKLVSLQLKLNNFQQNFVTFIANGPNPGSNIKWILLTKPIGR